MTNRKLFLLAVLFVGFLLAGSSALCAQSPAAETLLQKVNLRSAEPPPEAETTADAELGDIEPVQRYPKPEMFSLITLQQYFYTDNVYYTHDQPDGAMAYLGDYTLGFVPYSLRDWTPKISLQYNMVRYFGLSAADFDNENVSFSSQYVFGGDRSWTWTADIDLSRYTSASRQTEHAFYQEAIYDNQVAHTQKLVHDIPLFFVAAYDVAYHQANPADLDRLDNTLSFSLAWYPVSQLSIGPFVRPSYRIFPTNTDPTVYGRRTIFGIPLFVGGVHSTPPQHDRDDFNIAAGIDVTWTPIKYLSVSADFDAASDYSNNSVLSYDQTSPGVSLTGAYKF